MKSNCCNAEMRVAGTDEGTHWHECEKCGKACDAVDDTKPEPISDVEFDMAMLLVDGRFPNTAFVIRKWIEQREEAAWEAARRGAYRFTDEYYFEYDDIEGWRKEKGEK